MKRSDQIPFSPARWPFFYGWMILFWGVIGVVLSAPGQTTGVTAFTEPLLTSLHIKRVDLADAYLIGTVASSLLLTPAGKLFDRIGARWMGFLSSLMLGIVLLLLSQSARAFAPLSRMLPSRYAVLLLFGSLFFLLRFSGQGVLTMTSRNMIMKWFDRHRGLASGITGAATAFGFSYVPKSFHHMIEATNWSTTWWVLGIVMTAACAPLLLLFFRDNPDDCCLVPDGKALPKYATNKAETHHEFTLAEARRTWTFWAFALTIATQALVLTAVGFHMESIFTNIGMDKKTGYDMLPPAAAISVIINLTGGWLSDRVKLRWFLTTMLLAMSTYLMGFVFLRPGPIYWLIICAYGLSNGMFGILMSLTWPRYFGRKHLGAISGLCMTLMVVSSALGPALFSRSLEFIGSYRAAFIGCLCLALLLLLGSFRARNPQQRIRQNDSVIE
ncbi:MAG: MFS transporter [Pontiellaceae bacterium]|nr:MFS transporter [Pontiellaceae bacterium]